MGVERRGQLSWLTGRGKFLSERTAFKRQVPDWADREEPHEARVSRTDLWGPGGEIPPGYPMCARRGTLESCLYPFAPEITLAPAFDLMLRTGHGKSRSGPCIEPQSRFTSVGKCAFVLVTAESTRPSSESKIKQVVPAPRPRPAAHLSNDNYSSCWLR